MAAAVGDSIGETISQELKGPQARLTVRNTDPRVRLRALSRLV